MERKPTEADAAMGALDLHALGLREGNLDISIRPVAREYGIGDHIDLGADELSVVLWTVLQFGRAGTKKLEAHLRAVISPKE